MKIGLTSVFVHDPLEAFRFYTEVLGFVERLYTPEARLAIVASPEEPGGTGLLLEPDEHPAAKAYQEAMYAAGLPVIALAVEDVQKEYERLRERGVVFRKEPTRHEWATETVFDDTCGNLIQIHQP